MCSTGSAASCRLQHLFFLLCSCRRIKRLSQSISSILWDRLQTIFVSGLHHSICLCTSLTACGITRDTSPQPICVESRLLIIRTWSNISNRFRFVCISACPRLPRNLQLTVTKGPVIRSTEPGAPSLGVAICSKINISDSTRVAAAVPLVKLHGACDTRLSRISVQRIDPCIPSV